MDNYILIVEDDPDFEILLREAFYEAAAQFNPAAKSAATMPDVVVCRTGHDALNYLEQESVLPKLILLDIRLPGWSGLQVLSALKSSDVLKMISVIMLTTSNAQSDIQTAYARQAAAYLLKPRSYGELVETMQSLQEFYFNRNQFPTCPRFPPQGPRQSF